MKCFSPCLWGARRLIHFSSFYRNHMADDLPGQGRPIAMPWLAALWPWALSCGHTGLQFLSSPSMTHSRCWGLQGPCDSIPLVSVTFQGLVRTVARGVAQSAPVPTPQLYPVLSPPRELPPSPAAFWHRMLGSHLHHGRRTPPSSFLNSGMVLNSCPCSGEWEIPAGHFVGWSPPLPQWVLPAM